MSPEEEDEVLMFDLLDVPDMDGESVTVGI